MDTRPRCRLVTDRVHWEVVVHSDGMRVLRSAPQFATRDALKCAGVTLRQFRKQVRSLDARGPCAAAAGAVVMSSGSEVRRAETLKHPMCPPYATRAAGTDRLAGVRSAVRGVAGWSTTNSGDSRRVCAATAQRGSVAAQRDITYRSSCPPLIMTVLCSSGRDWSVRASLADPWTSSSPHVVAALAADPAREIRERVAFHPAAGSYLLERLASDSKPGVRIAVAHRPGGITEKVMRILAADRSPNVRCEVPAVAGCPDDLLAALATDPTPAVRAKVAALTSNAARSGCPQPLLEQLAEDGDASVRAAVAVREVPQRLLRILAADPAFAVRAAAASNGACTSEMLLRLGADRRGEVRQWVAAHSTTPAQILPQLSNDRAFAVRAEIAARSDCPQGAIERLACDEHPAVRTGAARNPQLPPGLYRRLAHDAQIDVRRAAMRNHIARRRCEQAETEMAASESG